MTLDMRRKANDKRTHIDLKSKVASNIVEENVEVIGKRPPGKKKVEKERKRKQDYLEDHDTEINKALSQMTEDRHKCMVERRTAVEKEEGDRCATF